MELKRPHTTEVIKKIVPPLAVWAVGALLEKPKVARAVNRIDRKIGTRKRSASRNVSTHRTLLVAGVAAIAAGLGLIATASSTKK
jgi:hypothetical protein